MSRRYRKLLALVWAFGPALGCAATPTEGDAVTAVFESTAEDRARAREAGKPVLLQGHAARFPAGAPTTGWAELAFVVRSDGSVSSVQVLDASDPVFAEPASAAVKTWVFEPSDVDREVSHRYFFTGPPGDHYQPTGNER
jgi:outer membrane biosynthesis protein TonB